MFLKFQRFEECNENRIYIFLKFFEEIELWLADEVIKKEANVKLYNDFARMRLIFDGL